jgi:hypothetical protein
VSLAGKGAVAIWHDIAPEGRAEFYAWHGNQHMPERTGIPGFLRGRRYVALSGSPEFFNLYETESDTTVTGAAYLERLNHPTPWTVATVKHFRGVSRSLCRVAASHGEGQGGLIATLRYDVAPAAAEAHLRRMTAQALPALARKPGVAGCHLLVADEAASAVETEERKARGETNLIPRWIVLVEGWGDAEPFAALCREFAGDPVLADFAPALNVYRLQNSRGRLPAGAP